MPTLDSKSFIIVSATKFAGGGEVGDIILHPIKGESNRARNKRSRQAFELVSRKLCTAPQSLRTSFDSGFLYAAAIAPWDGVAPKD